MDRRRRINIHSTHCFGSGMTEKSKVDRPSGLKEDLEYDQMTLKEYIDPFTGEPVKQNK